jgi:hypothetical protein
VILLASRLRLDCDTLLLLYTNCRTHAFSAVREACVSMGYTLMESNTMEQSSRSPTNQSNRNPTYRTVKPRSSR